jgi:hypothetical protein
MHRSYGVARLDILSLAGWIMLSRVFRCVKLAHCIRVKKALFLVP